MKIGIDATALPPRPVGAGTYTIGLIHSLAALESEFDFIVYAQKGGLSWIGSPDRPGFRFVTVPDKSPPARHLWEQTVFPWIVRRAGIDLLHSLHYTRPLVLSAASVVTFLDMTSLLFPHLHTTARRLYFPRMIRLSARTADALIAISESTRQDSIRLLGISPEKIVSIPLGVSERFRPVSDPGLRRAVRERYRLPERFLLFVGLVEPRKNLPLLLDAYRRLVDEASPPPLVIVGRDGWMHEAVYERTQSLGLKDLVHFTGYIPVDDLPVVYSLAHSLVYPSQYEGFGLPPLEAMACGTPVITSGVSSMPEYVGDAGLLVPPGDVGALATAMRALLANEDLRRDLSQRGRARAGHYTWERTALSTLQVYRQVLHNRSAK